MILPTLFFFNSLHTVCSMYGLSIYEIKRICHRARFFIISHGSFQLFADFLKNKNKNNNNRCPDYKVKIIVIFIVISIITHDIPRGGTLFFLYT